MRITNVRFIRVKGTWVYEGPLDEERLVRPIDIYPAFRKGGNFFLKHKISPVNGYIELPREPGLGADLDEDVVEFKEEINF